MITREELIERYRKRDHGFVCLICPADFDIYSKFYHHMKQVHDKELWLKPSEVNAIYTKG